MLSTHQWLTQPQWWQDQIMTQNPEASYCPRTQLAPLPRTALSETAGEGMSRFNCEQLVSARPSLGTGWLTRGHREGRRLRTPVLSWGQTDAPAHSITITLGSTTSNRNTQAWAGQNTWGGVLSVLSFGFTTVLATAGPAAFFFFNPFFK